MTAFLVMIFITYLSLSFILSFVLFILRDPKYYNVPQDEVSNQVGKIGAVAEIVVIFFQPLLGLAFDTIGRKIPIIIGMFMIGVSILLIPMGRNLYPEFLLFRISLSIGTVIGLNAPLLPDYVQPNYIGRANTIMEVVITAAYIFSSTGLM